ncbi:MAG: 50S ribosomal protein L15 [Desulfuromonadales bacterium]|nr:50S ribosomal protein L15 [Desulfuromonadales bacterium]
MRLHDLRRPKGAVKERKRLGRGPGSGLGKTAGKGHKGAKARSGYDSKRGFEGGQMPLQRRLPKVGFKNPFRKIFSCVNVCDLNRFEDGTEVTPLLLLEQGLIKKVNDGVKVLGKGELERRLVVVVHRISAGAREKIEGRGGEVKEA